MFKLGFVSVAVATIYVILHYVGGFLFFFVNFDMY